MPEDNEALHKVKEMSAAAEADPLTTRCIEGEAMFYLAHTHALIPGHVYSREGLREIRLSGYCEFHFDEIASAFDDAEEADRE